MIIFTVSWLMVMTCYITAKKSRTKVIFLAVLFSCFNKKLLMWYYVNFFMALFLSQGFLVALFFQKELDKYVDEINL